ncbi:hypothetical protein DVH05_019673 [Phytophthora capsici]|nr:hypothetical protein DVH05_019673 [Phytophthora capsici]
MPTTSWQKPTSFKPIGLGDISDTKDGETITKLGWYNTTGEGQDAQELQRADTQLMSNKGLQWMIPGCAHVPSVMSLRAWSSLSVRKVTFLLVWSATAMTATNPVTPATTHVFPLVVTGLRRSLVAIVTTKPSRLRGAPS